MYSVGQELTLQAQLAVYFEQLVGICTSMYTTFL
jgi:hypothetical protein